MPVSVSKPFCSGYQWILQLHVTGGFSGTKSVAPACGVRHQEMSRERGNFWNTRKFTGSPEHGTNCPLDPEKAAQVSNCRLCKWF